ncbi:MAG: flippase-like domain-containing protein [Gammaproteobacteria bacterium]|nr:flippase-like domain-containing protein [Gammaproteobacteria bacterium]
MCVLLSVLFYGAWVAFGGGADVWDSIALLGWEGWGIVLGLSLLNYGLRFVRWDLYLRQLGYRVPVWTNLRAYLAGFAFTTTPGKVGEAIRSVYLKPFGVNYTDSLAALFAERLADLLAMIVVASMAMFAFANARWLVGLAVLTSLVLIPLLHSRALRSWIERRVATAESVRIRSGGTHLLTMLESSRALLRSGPLYSGFVLGLIAWAAEGYGLYIVLERIGADVPALVASGIYGVSILAGVASFVPGGLGGTEVAMGSLLALSGVSAPLIVAAVLICRLATLWFAVLIGLVCLIDLELRQVRSVDAGAGKV